MHTLPSSSLKKYLEDVHNERLNIAVHTVCSHTETRSVSDGNGGTKTESHTVTTYDHTENMPYGECLGDEKNAVDINRGRYDFVLCKTISDVQFENGKADEELVEKFRKKTYEDNKHRDTHCSVTVNFVLSTIEPKQMVKYSNSCMFNRFMYEIASVLLCGGLYVSYVGMKAGQCDVVVTKRVLGLQSKVPSWNTGGAAPIPVADGAVALLAAAARGQQMQPMQQMGGQPMAGQIPQFGQPMAGQVPQFGQPLAGQVPQFGQSMAGQVPQYGQPPQMPGQSPQFGMGMQNQMGMGGGGGMGGGMNGMQFGSNMGVQPTQTIEMTQMQQGMVQGPPPVYALPVPTVPTVSVRVPIYGGGGSATAEYNGKLVMVSIPIDATPGAQINVPVPEGYY